MYDLKMFYHLFNNLNIFKNVRLLIKQIRNLM